MKRTRTFGGIALLVVAALLGSAFGFGLQRAWALPDCTQCNCKGVYRWWSPMMTGYSRGANAPGTTNPKKWAWSSIKSDGGCESGQQTKKDTCDIWNFFMYSAVCNNAGSYPQEVTVTDSGSALFYNQDDFVCQ